MMTYHSAFTTLNDDISCAHLLHSSEDISGALHRQAIYCTHIPPRGGGYTFTTHSTILPHSTTRKYIFTTRKYIFKIPPKGRRYAFTTHSTILPRSTTRKHILTTRKYIFTTRKYPQRERWSGGQSGQPTTQKYYEAKSMFDWRCKVFTTQKYHIYYTEIL